MDEDQTLTWMVVEDDQAIRQVLEMMCDLWGFQILLFKDGFAAMSYLEQPALPEPIPNIALLDIRMPGPWGHEVSRVIRQHNQLSNIGVLLMTAYELPGDDEQQYIEASGADGILYKPLPPMDDLLGRVRHVLADRK